MQAALFSHPGFSAYELLDSGGGEKLERFGDVVLRRPDPQALWRRRADAPWRAAHLRFVRESDRGGRWEPGKDAYRSLPALRTKQPEWTVELRGLSFLLRATPFKHVGLFPEQAANWDWVEQLSAQLVSGPPKSKRSSVSRESSVSRKSTSEPPRLLNLFGYTGVASVLAARSGFAVTHVDASKASVAWTRDNLRAAGLPERSLRLIVDDALAFVRREVRRGSSYAGILLDPPHYGRGPKGEKWQFEDGITPLLEACDRLLAERSFLVLSTYAIGYSPLGLANMLGELGRTHGGGAGLVAAGELALPQRADEGAGSGAAARLLPAGFCARWIRGLEPPAQR